MCSHFSRQLGPMSDSSESRMPSRLQLSTFLVMAAILWGLSLVMMGIAISPIWLRPLSIVTGGLLMALAAFDKRLWRLRLLHGWFVHRPDVNGTWRVIIRPVNNPGVSQVDGFMVIRQTFSTLSLRLLTAESSSELLAGSVVRAPDETYSLAGVYRNDPRLAVRDRSPIHHGGILLQVIGDPPAALKGHYWTDRSSCGEIELADRDPRVFHDFDSARAASRRTEKT